MKGGMVCLKLRRSFSSSSKVLFPYYPPSAYHSAGNKILKNQRSKDRLHRDSVFGEISQLHERGVLNDQEWERDMLAHLQTLENSSNHVPFYEIFAFIKAGTRLPNYEALVQRVIKLAKRSDVVDLPIYNSLLSHLGRLGKLNETLLLYKTMKDLHLIPDNSTLCALIVACGRANKLELAMKVLETLKKDGVQPLISAYNSFINACARNKDSTKLDFILNDLKNRSLAFDRNTYNALIDVYTGIGDTNSAKDILLKFLMDPSLELNATDSNVVSHVIRSCGSAGMLDEAFHIYSLVKQHPSMKPDVIVQSALIHACGQQGQVKKAMDVFNEMKELSQIIDKNGLPVHNTRPNVVTYTTLIQVLGKGKKFAKAAELYEEMKEEGVHPNLATFNALLNACAVKGDKHADMKRYLQDMARRRLRPNAITLHTILVALTNEDPELIRKRVELPNGGGGGGAGFINGPLVPSYGDDANVNGHHVNGEEEHQSLSPLALKMPGGGDSAISASSQRNFWRLPHVLAPPEGSAGDIDPIQNAIDKMHEIVSEFRLEPSLTAYYILLSACLKTGKPQHLLKGRELVMEITKLNLSPNEEMTDLMNKVMKASGSLLGHDRVSLEFTAAPSLRTIKPVQIL